MCVSVCPCTVFCKFDLTPAGGKHYIGSLCLLNTLGLSNLWCSETSHSISSVDRCHCSLSPLGAHSFPPACLPTPRLCNTTPDSSGQPPIVNKRDLPRADPKVRGKTDNQHPDTAFSFSLSLSVSLSRSLHSCWWMLMNTNV